MQEVSAALANSVPYAISKSLGTDVGAPERQTQLLDIARTLQVQLVGASSAKAREPKLESEPERGPEPLLPEPEVEARP
jgi:hypothetical protein